MLRKIRDEELNYQNKTFHLTGTIRRKTPIETLAVLKPLLKTFEITRVADIGGLDTFQIPVTTAIRPNAKHLCGAQGKGVTRELAQISAIMEAIESYHMENPPEPSLIGSYNDLKQKWTVIDPLIFPLGKLQHKDLKSLAMGWIEAFDLLNEEEVYIPHSLIKINPCHTDSVCGFFTVSSNGLASGNTINEAILHALYEVIERDAVWRWLKKPKIERQATSIDTDTILTSENKNLIQKITAVKAGIKIWDVTSELGIPTYYCTIYDTENLNATGVFYGSGTHLLADIALSRAITEAVQSRTTFISGSRDDMYPKFYEKQRALQKKLIVEFLTKDKQEIPAKISYYPYPESQHSDSLFKNIENIIECLRNKGYQQVIVFDHTKQEFNVPVVQVFVPGLIFRSLR